MPALLTPRLNVFVRDRLNAKTMLISANCAGTGGGSADSFPAGISTNGQFVLFESSASDLVANDTNGVSDVFVRDVINNTNILVSVTAAGFSGNGESRSPVMTPDGRYVAFVSAATNLVAGDTNQIPDVFVRDLQAGTTVRVSVGAKLSSGSSSETPVITPDGRYVAFYSTATNLVPGVKNSGEVYVRDLVAGTTCWASTNAQTIVQSLMSATAVISYDPQISADGQFVAFTAKPATIANPAAGQGVILRYNLPTGITDVVFTNAVAALSGFEADAQILDLTPDGRFIAFVANAASSSTCIYQWDALNATNILVSGNLSNGVTAGTTSSFPVQTPDGRFVAFFCNDTNLTTTLPPARDNLYVRDMQAGATVFVDHNTGVGLGVDPSAAAALSDDGRFIAFERTDGNLVPNDSTHDRDVFVTDLTLATTELISAHHPALPSLTPNGTSWLFSSSVSTNGRFIAFASDAANLVANDTNGCRDVFVHDFLSGANILVSADTNGAASAGGASTEPAISGDGRFVAFSSYATNIVAGDTNTAKNVFIRDLQSGTTVLVSVNTNGGFGNHDSYSPTISSDGRYVLFHSLAQNLAGTFGGLGTENLFLRDRLAGQTYALTTDNTAPSTQSASMTPDGHFVAFVGVVSSSPKLFIWNSQLTSLIYTNSVAGLSVVSISPDGQTVAYLAGSPLTLSVVNLASNSKTLVSAGTFLSHSGLRFSADGRFLTYATSAANVSADTNAIQDVYVYDCQTATNLLVSWNSDFTGTPNGASDSPSISPDGRFVAYRSYAGNIVTNDSNGLPDIFLFDRANNTTTLLSADPAGNFAANNRSVMPVFSGDGLTLGFQSAASDFVAHDFNNSSDILAFDLIALPGTGLGGFGSTNSTPVFYTQLNFHGVSAQNPSPLLSWPLVSGKSYRAQFKDDMGDPNWQDVNGSIFFIGGTGYINDLSPSSNQRFYRIVLNN